MFDIAILGGGLVGVAIGHGLAGLGQRTALLDEGDLAYRASRGNFALVWVQSKGMGMPAYGAWTRRSSDAYAAFAAALREETGVDIAHQRPGGYSLALSEAELERRQALLMRLHNQPGWAAIPWEVQSRAEVQRALPEIGPEVVGGIFCPLDGHVNSLRLFRALHAGFARRGGTYLPDRPAASIHPLPGGGFRIETPAGPVEAGKVVLAAGNGNARLGPMVGIEARVRPQRGQVLVTEKLQPFLHHPVVTIRQTDEGGVMMGDSAEEAGFDTAIGLGVLATIADRAQRMFPLLGRANVVRSWSALRVMTQDGFPIYQESPTAPGAFLATCHSGVTLAANHATLIAGMIAAGALDPALAPFSTDRFHVPPPA
jgi:hydrogen cyanide synthase HcnC